MPLRGRVIGVALGRRLAMAARALALDLVAAWAGQRLFAAMVAGAMPRVNARYRRSAGGAGQSCSDPAGWRGRRRSLPWAGALCGSVAFCTRGHGGDRLASNEGSP